MLVRALHPQRTFQALDEFCGVVWRYRHLIVALAKRDISSPYAGQVFGAFWAFAHPLFLGALYIFIFSVVFKARMAGGGVSHDLPRDYTTYILAGLVPWLGIGQSLARSVGALTGQTSLVKQVVFPIEILPLVSVFVATFTQILGLMIVLGYLLYQGTLPWTIVLLPVVMLLQLALMVGLAFALSALAVFLRDLKDFVQVFTTAGIFVAPIVYLPQWVPGIVRPIIYINPFSYVIWCYQDIIYFGRFEHPIAWLVLTLGSLLVLAVGYRLFTSLKPQFGTYL